MPPQHPQHPPHPPKYHPPKPPPDPCRIECVITCVGFDDLLDVTLPLNHQHFDTIIVVTTHDDKRTQGVCQKNGAICVQTDLFGKNQRVFNKGAAINEGMSRFQYRGWRCHMDADIVVPDGFRRLLFNHTHLDENSIYGADRVDVLGKDQLLKALREPQHLHSFLMVPNSPQRISPRYVDTLRGYIPIGYFQLWNSACQKDYPWSLGSAAHDDVLFASQWPRSHRRLLPTVLLWHLTPEPTCWGQNWEGRKTQRL